MTLAKNAFTELSQFELQSLNGGGWFNVFCAIVGGLAVAFSPVVAVVAPPAGGLMFAGGMSLLGVVYSNYRR